MPSITPALHQCQAPDPDTNPGNVTAKAGRLRFSPPGRGRTWLPGASAPNPGITLSDASEQGERAHCRRYVRHSPFPITSRSTSGASCASTKTGYRARVLCGGGRPLRRLSCMPV